MTKPPAMPELPEPDYWSTRDDDTPLYTADQMRAYALAALQSAQPAEVSDEELLTAYNSIDPCNESPTDRLIRRLRAILALRPDAVPMTPEQVRALVVECGYDHASTQERADFINGVRTGERWRGITAQGAQGGEG